MLSTILTRSSGDTVNVWSGIFARSFGKRWMYVVSLATTSFDFLFESSNIESSGKIRKLFSLFIFYLELLPIADTRRSCRWLALGGAIFSLYRSGNLVQEINLRRSRWKFHSLVTFHAWARYTNFMDLSAWLPAVAGPISKASCYPITRKHLASLNQCFNIAFD